MAGKDDDPSIPLSTSQSCSEENAQSNADNTEPSPDASSIANVGAASAPDAGDAKAMPPPSMSSTQLKAAMPPPAAKSQQTQQDSSAGRGSQANDLVGYEQPSWAAVPDAEKFPYFFEVCFLYLQCATALFCRRIHRDFRVAIITSLDPLRMPSFCMSGRKRNAITCMCLRQLTFLRTPCDSVRSITSTVLWKRGP